MAADDLETRARSETREQVVERLAEQVLDALEIDNEVQVLRIQPSIRQAIEWGARAHRERDARIAADMMDCDPIDREYCPTCGCASRILGAIRKEGE